MRIVNDVLTDLDLGAPLAYESAAEEAFGERVRRAIRTDSTLSLQVSIDSPAGLFRLDFLLVDPSGRRIGIEVDGREFHQGRRDFWRTAVLLGMGAIDVEYRVQATDTSGAGMLPALAYIASREPRCFPEERVADWGARCSSVVSTALDSLHGIERDIDGLIEYDQDSDQERLSRNNFHPVRHDFRRAARAFVMRWEASNPGYRPHIDFALKQCAQGVRDLRAIDAAWRGRDQTTDEIDPHV